MVDASAAAVAAEERAKKALVKLFNAYHYCHIISVG